jgi:hypothetical protein
MNRWERPERPRALARRLAAAVALAIWPSAAAAAEDDFGPRNSATLSFFSIFGPGLSLEYERYAPFRLRSWRGMLIPLSVMSGLGFRTTGGDYTTLTISTSLELRLWLTGRGPWSTLGEHAMVGPFVALREDASFTWVHDDTRDRLAGTAVELSETLSIGYRLTAWQLAFTPSLGFALTTQVDPGGRLAPITYPAAKFALTLGVLF